MKKVNRNYLKESKYIPASSNIKNKEYIDIWIKDNYNSLFLHFNKKKDLTNSRGYSQIDIFHDSLLRIYTNKLRTFISQEDANNYLNLFFKLV